MKISELITVLGFQVDDRELKRATSAVHEFKKLVAGIGIGYLMYQGAHAAATTAAAYQSSEAQFTTLLKSQVEAQKLMKDLFQYAKESTFEMTHVTKAQDILMSYGMEVGEAFEVMKRLGDVAGADAAAFSRLALATAQVYGKTRLMGEEQRQFLNARGGMLAQEVANMYFGGDRAKMEAAQRARKVSYEMMLAALRKLTDEGGRLYGNQANQMNTLLGRWNQMRDNLKMSGAMMVMAIERPLKAIMTFIANIDFTPIINGFRLLGHSLEYVASVVWQTGLKETWAEFVVEMKKLGYEFGAITDRGDGLGSVLYVIGMAVRFALTMILTGIPYLVAFMKEVWRLVAVLGRLSEYLEMFKWALAGVFGPVFVTWVYRIAVSTITLSGTLSGLVSAITGVRAAVAAWGAASMLNPVMLFVAALGSVLYAIVRINDALREKRELEMSNEQHEKMAAALEKARIAENTYLTARQRGSARDIEGAERRLAQSINAIEAINPTAAAVKTFRERMGRIKDGTYGRGAPGGDPTSADGMPSIEKIMADPSGAIKDMQRLAERGTKIQNVNIESNINVDVKGGTAANTGLSAQDVAELAKTAARSVFSMEVLAISEGTL